MGWLKDTAGSVGKWGWDNLVPDFKRGGRTGRTVVKVVVVKPKRKVQRKKRTTKK